MVVLWQCTTTIALKRLKCMSRFPKAPMLALDGAPLWRTLRWSFSRQKVQQAQCRLTTALTLTHLFQSPHSNPATAHPSQLMVTIMCSWQLEISTAASQTHTLSSLMWIFLWSLHGAQQTMIWRIMIQTIVNSNSYSRQMALANTKMSPRITRNSTKLTVWWCGLPGLSSASLSSIRTAGWSTNGAGISWSTVSSAFSLWELSLQRVSFLWTPQVGKSIAKVRNMRRSVLLC